MQRIVYADSKSNTLAKLDGTYKQPAPPAAAAPAEEDKPTTLQQSIFAGPPGTAGPVASANNPPPGLQPKPNGTDDAASVAGQGIKRPREESDDEKDEAPMDMDDEAMEESDPE